MQRKSIKEISYDTLNMKLRSGSYIIICPLENHLDFPHHLDLRQYPDLQQHPAQLLAQDQQVHFLPPSQSQKYRSNFEQFLDPKCGMAHQLQPQQWCIRSSLAFHLARIPLLQ
ncbi:proteasome subunit alpha type-1-B [Trifolium repens]|nr:proteasome subunit alpha type-1-B [Trifolium repens]